MFKGFVDFEKKLCSHVGTLPGYAYKSYILFNNAFFEFKKYIHGQRIIIKINS